MILRGAVNRASTPEKSDNHNTSLSSTSNLSDLGIAEFKERGGKSSRSLSPLNKREESGERTPKMASFSLTNLEERGPFIPEFATKIEIPSEQPEEIRFDAVHNFEVYFPHNNVTKILDELEAKRKNVRTIGARFTSANEMNLFKIKLGRILEKSKLKKNMLKNSNRTSSNEHILKVRTDSLTKNNGNSMALELPSKHHKSSLELGV